MVPLNHIMPGSNLLPKLSNEWKTAVLILGDRISRREICFSHRKTELIIWYNFHSYITWQSVVKSLRIIGALWLAHLKKQRSSLNLRMLDFLSTLDFQRHYHREELFGKINTRVETEFLCTPIAPSAVYKEQYFTFLQAPYHCSPFILTLMIR